MYYIYHTIIYCYFLIVIGYIYIFISITVNLSKTHCPNTTQSVTFIRILIEVNYKEDFSH